MASTRYAGLRAKIKARQVFKRNRRKSKRAVLKKFANFVGKVTFKVAKRTRKRKGLRRKSRRRMYRRIRRRIRKYWGDAKWHIKQKEWEKEQVWQKH